MTVPILLLASIAGTGVVLGGIIAWARNRQYRAAPAPRQAPEPANAAESSGKDSRNRRTRA